MVDVWLPYGETEICARIPTKNFLGLIEPKEKPGVTNPTAEIQRALNDPIGSKGLSELATARDNVVIVVDDATRSTPSHLMIQPVLNELNKAGVADSQITIIFGCGIHRPVTNDEMKRLLGNAVLERVSVLSHTSDSTDLVYLGKTSFGTRVHVNPKFAAADVKVLTGDIGFHYYAGYGGGRKSVLPAVSGQATIKHNHSLLLNAKATTGILEGNPVHEDMVEAAKLAEVDFILNIVTNSQQKLVRAFAGDLDQAFHAGVSLVDEMYKVPVHQRADILVLSAGGYPNDINLYQAYKGIDNALNAVKKGGVIILAAECSEGHGNQLFYDWMIKYNDLKRMEKAIKNQFVIGGHKAYYLLKALQKARIILISTLPDYYAVNTFKLKTARALNDALQSAFNLTSKQAKIWAMPHGNITLPIFKPK